jgi:DnaD/phage-associated family protein
MSPSWYCEIDNWFTQYRFDPQVVYALFNECMRRKKLDSKAYISKVALNWSKQGIVSYDDLNRYFLTYDKVIKLSKKVGQKLRKNITEYDEEIVAGWVDKMKYDFDIVDIALKKTSKLSNPNLEYANKLLEEWFSKGLVTTEQIIEYEKDKQLKFFSEKKKQEGNFPNTNNNRSNGANFKQTQYSDEYLEQMLEDVTQYIEKPNSDKTD